MLKVGILGVGAIGRTIATAIDEKQVNAQLVALCDQQEDVARQLSAQLSSKTGVMSIAEMLAQTDVAIEAASQAALPSFVPAAIAHKRNVIILSVGGLLGHDDWFRQATEKGCKIYVPSGA